MTTNRANPIVSEVEESFSKQFPAQLDGEEIKEEVRFTWAINDWSKLETNAMSEPFEAGKRRWRALLFPEGNGSAGSRGSISLFLKLLHPGDEGEEPAADTDNAMADAPDDPAGEDDECDDSTDETRPKKAKNHATVDDAFKNPAVTPDPSDATIVHVKTGPAPESDVPVDGAICVSVSTILWNPQMPELFHVQHFNKRYEKSVQDWGYSQFMSSRSALTAGNNPAPIVQDGKANVTVLVRVINDPTGMLWRDDFRDYDSKQLTGYIGLLNQGATCYLNSLLQSLYFTKVFRQTVYKIINDSNSDGTLSGNLQRLFFQLSTSRRAVGTLALTRSFGWDSADAFTQHDVQELARVLMDKLEGTLKGSPYEKELSKMFVGQMKSFIKCINIDFESARVEDFWDIQLNVRGCKDVYESFENYVESELLTGENQYHATDHGLQDARKGVTFESFPPVLHLQLKRYDYDYIRDMEVKINDRYEYPMELDLSRFVDPESKANDSNEPWTYALHGVLVHSGDLNAGHYYALIKPDSDGNWYRFDDDYVTRAATNEVLEANFGGESLNAHGRGVKRISSAYMLVYIRKSRLDYVLPKEDDVVPVSIVRNVEREHEQEMRQREADLDRDRHLYIRIMTAKRFNKHSSIGLGQWYGDPEQPSAPEVHRFRRNRTIADFLTQALKKAQMPKESTLWLVSPRESVARRISPLQGFSTYEVDSLSQWSEANTPIVWLEDKPGDIETQLLIFIKEYNADKQTLRGIASRWVNKTDTIGSLFSNQDVNAFKEFKSKLIPLNPDALVGESSIEYGTIIVVETNTPDQAELTPESIYMSATDFYDLLNHQIGLVLIPKEVGKEQVTPPSDDGAADKTHEENGTTVAEKTVSPPPLVTASTLDSYSVLASRIGKAINVDPSYLALYAPLFEGLTQIKSDGSNLDILFPFTTTTPDIVCKVVYEVLDKPLTEYEEYHNLTLTWFSEHMSQVKQTSVFLHKSTTAAALVKDVAQSSEIPAEQISRIKVWVAPYASEVRELGPETTVGELDGIAEVYFSIIPAEEWDVREGTKAGSLTTIFHFYKQISNVHSVPFSFALLDGEPWNVTKERLRKLVGISEKVFEKIPIVACRRSSKHSTTLLQNEDEILYDSFKDGDLIGLDRADKRRNHGMHSAIVIK